MSDPIFIAGASAVSKPVIEKSFGKVLEWIGEPVSLLYHFKDNAKDLEKQVSLLEDKKNTVERCEQTAGRRGEETVDEFQKWQTDASTLIGDARVLEVDGENAKKTCFFGLCFNPWSRYKFSKKAKKKSESIAQHVSKANEFNLSYSHAPAPVIEKALPVKGYEDFSSRRGVLDQIMEELREKSRVNMIGLYGMAGAGKTTMIMEVKRKAEEVKLFDMVVLAKVTNKPEQEKIRNDIARGIGMDLLPAGLDSHQVTNRIKAKLLELMQKEKKVLIILDDLWAALDLEEVGIPFEETGSSKLKILMTSRDCNVLERQMGTQKKFAIGQLGDEEAWQLFKKIVGDRAEHPELRPIGEKIVKECGGLPLAIATLAKALKKENSYAWSDALTKVRSPSPHNFTGGAYSQVYIAIEVSFNHLETEKLQKTLLLCCMMGHGTSIQDLLRCGVGLGLFPQANTIEEARNELLTLIDSLKAASLLIDDSNDKYFDMHDLVYDVAISIAHRDRQGLLMNDASQNLPDMELVEGFKWIILKSADFIELFDWSKCSDLALLSVVGKPFWRMGSLKELKVPENAFERMESLKVLKLTRMDMPSLPSSICFLKKLHTLRLRWSRLGDMSLIGELKSLEILDLQGSEFEELPREMGELTRLKSLDLHYCDQLVVIPPRVLESLTRLEELYLDDRFSWGDLKGDESRENSNLYELKHLKKLTTLHTKIADVTMIPEDLLSSNLKSYRIFIGGVKLDSYLWSYDVKDRHDPRLLAFNSGTNIYQCNECPINPLLKTVTLLKLENFNGVKNLVDGINNEGFPNLKGLSVVTCPALQHITNSRQGVLLKAFPNLEVMALKSLPKLEKIFQGRFEETSFSKLRKVEISECAELKVLFSSSIATQLVQLQELVVKSCSKVEVIVDDMEQAGGLDDMEQAGVHLKAFPNLEVMALESLPKLEKVFQGRFEETSFSKLRKVKISECAELKILFSSSIATQLVQLQELEVNRCSKVEVIVDDMEQAAGLDEIVEATEAENPTFGEQLRILKLHFLPKLVSLKSNCRSKPFFNDQVIFPNLEELQLEGINANALWQTTFFTSFSSVENLVDLSLFRCHNLEYLFSSAMVKSFVKLKKLEISNCNQMKKVIAAENDEDLENVIFPALELLRISGTPNLVGFYIGICRVEFPGMKGFAITPTSADALFNEQVVFPNLKKLQLEGINANALWHTTYFTSFSSVENLVDLSLHACHNLEYLFSSTMVKSFVKLKNLQISGCDRMKKVIVTENEEDLENVIFPALELLSISKIPKLVRFYIGICRVEFPYLKELRLGGFSGMKRSAITPTSADNRADALFNEQVIFPNLEKLRLEGTNALWHTTYFTSFSFVENLVELSLCDCNHLEYFFPSAMVKSFVKLKKLEISSCYRVKKVIAAENDENLENVIFPTLELLRISGTPNLVGFYIGICRVEFPYLKELSIRDCPEMKGFAITPTSADNRADIHTLFNEQVRFSKLKILSIYKMESLIKICDDQLDGEIFCKLNELSVDSCGKLMNLFPIYILKRLHQLEISRCPSLEEICGSLEKNASQSQDSTGTHPTLGDDEVKDEIVFHELKHLKLYLLERLKIFCSLKCKVEFPSLEKAIVMSCPRMQNFSTGQSITPKLRKVCWTDQDFNETGSWKDDLNSTIAEMFAKKVGYSSLEFISFVTFPELITIWDKKPQEFLNFRILKTLKVCNLTSLSYLLSPAMALDLVQLCELEIKNCNAMEQVILGEVSEAALFPKLSRLRLQYLPKLTSFCSGKSIELFRLEELELWHCYSLKTFITSSNSGGMIESSTKAAHTSTTSLFDAKVRVPNLWRLTIGSTESFDKIWDDHLGADAFCKLNYLFVAHCGNLLYIFPSSILDRLHQLKMLKIWGCYSLEEILGSAKQSATWSQDPMSSQSNLANDEVMDGIIFGELWHLELCSLGRLKTFCSLKCKVELPSLVQALVMGCPSMQHFCTGEPTTPKLKNVRWTRDAKEGSWKGDLNTTIQEMFIKKVGYSSFEFLDLGSFPEFISIWNKIPQETLNFKILQRLYVCNIKSLSYLLTPSMASDLVQLCELKIMNCDAMEQVIVGEVSEGTLLFPELEWLWLEDLPKLTSFCLGNSIELSCLEYLRIHKCHLLTTFIASSNPGDDTPALFDAKATFPSLAILELEYGDAIIEIWRGENPGDHFPKLTDVELINFPEQSIELSTFFLQSLPELENLEVNGVSREISQKHGANLVIEDMRMSGRHYEIGECSGARSANVLEESNSVTEEEKVNASEEKDEADESENNSNDLEESNGGR